MRTIKMNVQIEVKMNLIRNSENTIPVLRHQVPPCVMWKFKWVFRIVITGITEGPWTKRINGGGGCKFDRINIQLTMKGITSNLKSEESRGSSSVRTEFGQHVSEAQE